MLNRLFLLPLLLAACGTPAAPPATPVTEPTPDPALTSENETLRAQVTELESRLTEATDARDSAVAMNIEVASELEKAQSALAAANKKTATPRRPVPGVQYSIPLHDGVIDGKNNALVTLVVATEVACPFCWRAEDTLEQLRKDYGKELRIVYQSRIVHPVAREPARALCAANKQRKGMKMYTALRAQWDAYRGGNRQAFARSELLAVAKKLRIKTKKLEKDMDNACTTEVEKQNSFFSKLGVNGTPTFFINGKVLSGARPIDNFKAIIDVELAAARDLVANGIDRRSLYPSIVSFGKKTL